ncbi:DNA-binding response regulator, OmpR family, contains REC and winged-helix (wHTH) domain [Parapedobacter indicus]|uniref:DNA-binding response regulator, OmpR family, contains REC and winged-helix (WHTH) domain n=1 Tax=Parapedobacter indicus TaxID=1477437 RepID=A0A1I3UY86_9SPHI|nr:DNA-binding response OmpR family regulator [Parapedobacter indicus]SFJ86857.1 DNA-binding response regulator, OmpR family, contains REC and winged-helix (wHTH) domain [Parapedobacter indicus]
MQQVGKLKVLLAEDEPFLGKIVKESLESRNFDVLWVQDGLKAYSAFRTFDPAICILDVMMPVKDGYALTEDIRKLNDRVPIIFLTAKSLTEDVVKGFELGGNDYLKKPFSMEELIVRMNALLNRTAKSKASTKEQFVIGNYLFNNALQELVLGDDVVKLSFRESALLKMLMEHKNQVLDRKTALDFLWGGDSFFNARSMDVFITKLRKHLKKDDAIEIVNIRGVGYKLIVDEGFEE